MSVFKSRSFCYAKDPENPDQNQDAFQISETRGMAVVADGVSSAIFSAAWANLLTQSIIEEQPDPENQADFARWLARMRQKWEQSIDTTNLAWFQRPKMAAGAFSTLLWVTVREIVPPTQGSPQWEQLKMPDENKRCFHVSGFCIGDSCLFHVRPGRNDSDLFPKTDLYRAIPLKDPKDFENSPVVIGSKDLGHDERMKFRKISFLAQEGDLVILATDAVSQWLLKSYVEQAFPRWDVFWELNQKIWEKELDSMRAAGEIRYDDSTLVLLQLGSSEEFLTVLPEYSETLTEELATDGQTTVERDEANDLDLGLESELEMVSPQVTQNPDENSAPETFAPEEERELPTEAEEFYSADENPADLNEFEDSVFPREVTADEMPETSGELENEELEKDDSVRSSSSVSAMPSPVSEANVPTSGFQYRLASSSSPRKFLQSGGTRRAGAEAGTASDVNRSSVSPASSPSPVSSASRTAHSIPRVQEVQLTQDAERDLSNSAAKLSENWQQIRESTVQIAGILGEHLSEKMSQLGSEVNRVGSHLNDGVTQLGQNARPKIQGVAQKLSGWFKRKGKSETDSLEEAQENEAEAKPVRVIDPNRRRFYNPPPRE
ncbi:MAG: protein phosphatase 2C domain-containing protein [Thermoguttaceae bacterium]|nr:protein phosphatase 2C domain-containing protein [Thermoguttaceae bacterium]